MKKLLLLALGAFLLTGCGGDKVTCSKETEKDVYKLKEEHTVEFSGDKMINIDMTMVTIFEDESVAKSEMEVAEYAEASFEEKGFECDITRDGKEITIKISADEEAIAKLAENETTSSEYSLTKEQFKEESEAEGYTCK